MLSSACERHAQTKVKNIFAVAAFDCFHSVNVLGCGKDTFSLCWGVGE